MEWWTIAGVIIAFIGLLIGIVKPIIKLNTVIATLSVIVETIGNNLESLTDKNSEAHGKIWDKLGEHDTDIAVLKEKVG